MFKETLKNYETFVEKQKEEKKERLEEIMKSLSLDLSIVMNRFGWERKTKGGVTKNMVDTHIMKFDYIKTYDGETVTLTISTNLGDDYTYCGGYNQLSIKGSKSVKDPSWWKGGTGSHFNYYTDSLDHSKFELQNQLKLVDETYKK